MPEPKRIGLALQGGGAHGAFTWGVLDRLLDEVEAGRIEIAAISGTSAGALNGAALALGLLDGPAQARALLAELWTTTAAEARLTPFVITAAMLGIERCGDWNLDDSFAARWLDASSLAFSPYDWRAPNLLAPVIAKALPHLHRLDRRGGPGLFVCATRVSDNARKIFKRGEIDANALLASACLPTDFESIEIAGERYWDGGYMGNPALEPLISHRYFSDPVEDLLVVRVNPLRRTDGWPTSTRQIADRLNEITFNASLVLEVNGICAVNALLARAPPDCHGKYRQIRLHAIANDGVMQRLGHVSKLNPYAPFLDYLRSVGREAADEWLRDHWRDLGQRTSWNIDEQVKKRMRQ